MKCAPENQPPESKKIRRGQSNQALQYFFTPKKKHSFTGLIALLILLFSCASSYGAERAVVKVELNGEDKGEYFVLMSGGGRVLVSVEDLLQMGFREAPAAAETGEEGAVYIDSLRGGVKAEFDATASALYISAEPSLLRKNTVDFARRPAQALYYAGSPSAFFNYGITLASGSGLDLDSLTVPLELGVSGAGWLGLSDFAFTKSDTDEKFVRLLSRVIRDDPGGLRRLIVGDFQAFSGDLGGAATLGGLSISRDFSMGPFFIRTPGLSVTGMLSTPSEVEIYTNDILLKRYSLSPGEFEFLNLPNLNGAGKVEVLIRDAFGREERTVIPYYASRSLLQKGLHDYSYNLGFKRNGFGRDSFSYDGPAFLAYHRAGFSDSFTGGLRAEADGDVLNAGLTATMLLGNFGLLDTSFAFSLGEGRSGYGVSSSYSYAGRHFSGGLSARAFSRDYANLSLSESGDKPRFEGAAGLGYRDRMFGAVSATYAETDLYKEKDRKRMTFYYSRNLMRNVLLNVIASKTEAEETSYEVFAGLTFILGRNTSAGLSHTIRDDGPIETASLQQDPPYGTGFGYRAAVERVGNSDDRGAETGGNGFLQYRGAYGIYSAYYLRDAGESSYMFSAYGGVSFINRSLYLSRPVTDSFALVKVGEFENAQVNYNNQEVGRTNSKGELLVPGLIAYYPNDISINDRDFPVNYEIPELRALVSLPYRGGGVVKFDLKKLQAFVGRLFIVEKGSKREAEYWGLAVGIKGSVVEAAVGKKGEFYMENVPPGRLQARLFTKEKECIFTINIPQSDEAMVDLGEVVCEMD